MNFSFENQGYVGVLKFYGELTLKQESELTEALMVSLDNTDYLVVNLHNVTVPDCSSLKPIWSAHLIARRQHKSLMLIGVDKEALKCDMNHYKYSEIKKEEINI